MSSSSISQKIRQFFCLSKSKRMETPSWSLYDDDEETFLYSKIDLVSYNDARFDAELSKTFESASSSDTRFIIGE